MDWCEGLSLENDVWTGVKGCLWRMMSLIGIFFSKGYDYTLH